MFTSTNELGIVRYEKGQSWRNNKARGRRANLGNSRHHFLQSIVFCFSFRPFVARYRWRFWRVCSLNVCNLNVFNRRKHSHLILFQTGLRQHLHGKEIQEALPWRELNCLLHKHEDGAVTKTRYDGMCLQSPCREDKDSQMPGPHWPTSLDESVNLMFQ